jgi:potassium-transporting ATPase KdpC subunit
MKKYIWPSVKLTLIFILLCSVLYPLFIAAVAKLAPGQGKGETISLNGKVVGYERLGQKFTDDKYFQGRPSTVNYNAAGSAGSNKSPTNPDYLKDVQERIDTFLVHNPGVRKEDIPADLVTASGSGLDPDISPEAAYIQVKRVAKIRGLTEENVKTLVDRQVEKLLLGPSHVHVLKLNIALDQLK